MSGAPVIAIVDDDDALRNSLDDLIRSIGFRALGFPSAEAFLSSNQARDTACLILEVRMPGMSGLDLQHQNVAAKFQSSSLPRTQMTLRAQELSKPARWLSFTNHSMRKNYSKR